MKSDIAGETVALESSANYNDYLGSFCAVANGGNGTLSAGYRMKNGFNVLLARDVMDGRWHHFALVYDDATYEFRLYVDHELKDTQVMPEAYRPGDGFSDIWFASGGKLNRSSFEGWIDEVRMTRKALSPEQFMNV